MIDLKVSMKPIKMKSSAEVRSAAATVSDKFSCLKSNKMAAGCTTHALFAVTRRSVGKSPRSRREFAFPVIVYCR